MSEDHLLENQYRHIAQRTKISKAQEEWLMRIESRRLQQQAEHGIDDNDLIEQLVVKPTSSEKGARQATATPPLRRCEWLAEAFEVSDGEALASHLIAALSSSSRARTSTRRSRISG